MRGLGKWLVRGGLVVWGVGALAAVSGVWVTMPPAVVEWLVLSLAATSGGLLVAAGVAVGRLRSTETVTLAIPEPSEAGASNIGGRAPGMVLPRPDALRSAGVERGVEHDRTT